jgi:hypothetical protein
VSRAPNCIVVCSVTPPELTWHDHCVSIHEAGHIAAARFFGLPVHTATMGHVDIRSRPCLAPGDCASVENLIVNAAGTAATTLFLNYTDGGVDDKENSRTQLRHLGTGHFQTHYLMKMARKAALRLVWDLKPEIFAVAQALRQQRSLTQDQIDNYIGEFV